ncbi:MAG: pyridoxamine kinase [Clostridia bacterium]|nr:pyridoxamine kinase [Clostridia bacterium]
MQKRAIAVHDISCVGRCSLTVALPVLSAAGLNTAVVPTALLSTHTGEFTGYTHMDLSDQLHPIAQHLSTLGLHYDTFYSGYLANGAQADEVLRMMDLLCDAQTHIFVDPAFGDHGRMYSLMDESMPRQMRRLVSRARTIVPNKTEAAFLLGEPYPGEEADEACISDYCCRLAQLGPQNVVITDVSFRPGQTGVAVYSQGMAQPVYLFRERIDRVFHGTGDVFASFLLGALMNNQPLETAVNTALDFTHAGIRETLASGEPLRYGVQFEKVLPAYWERLMQK